LLFLRVRHAGGTPTLPGQVHGERISRNKTSRVEPLNRPSPAFGTLSINLSLLQIAEVPLTPSLPHRGGEGAEGRVSGFFDPANWKCVL
jgi:hypothetical protein